MENPRAEKVAVVEEVRERLDASSASVVTEYRGLTVTELAQLRRSLAAAGGSYKIYKNTLVRRAVDGSPHAALTDLLTGPTALAFVDGDVGAVAKALRDFSRTNPALVVKGGLLEGGLLSASDLAVLADLPSRDVLLGMVAGVLAAPLRQLAGLMQALPRNFAYGLSALAERRQGESGAAESAAPAGDAASEGAMADGGATAAADGESAAGGEATAATETTES